MRLIWISVLGVLLALAYAYIGYFHSVFYRMELVILGIVLIFSAVLTMFWSFTKKSNYTFHFTIFWGLNALLFSVLITIHIVDTYKPTLVIQIPEQYEGMIHLFPSPVRGDVFESNTHGICYIPNEGEFDFKVLHGTRDISNVLNEYGRTSITIDGTSNFTYKAIEVTCFEVHKNQDYPSSPWNQKHASCMTQNQFDSLASTGVIDTLHIAFKEFPVLRFTDIN